MKERASPTSFSKMSKMAVLGIFERLARGNSFGKKALVPRVREEGEQRESCPGSEFDISQVSYFLCKLGIVNQCALVLSVSDYF